MVKLLKYSLKEQPHNHNDQANPPKRIATILQLFEKHFQYLVAEEGFEPPTQGL